MIANEVAKLEKENQDLKDSIKELERKMKQVHTPRPKSCRFCKNYIQHYRKSGDGYAEIYAGHCISGVPLKKGGKRNPFPDDCCPYFELGTPDTSR